MESTTLEIIKILADLPRFWLVCVGRFENISSKQAIIYLCDFPNGTWGYHKDEEEETLYIY